MNSSEDEVRTIRFVVVLVYAPFFVFVQTHRQLLAVLELPHLTRAPALDCAVFDCFRFMELPAETYIPLLK